jgi:hypothetical protein
MKNLKFKILALFLKPYIKYLNSRIVPLINLIKYLKKFRFLILLFTIWRFHNIIYSLTAFLFLVVFGVDLINFLNFINVIYLSIYNFFLELKLIIHSWFSNDLIKSIEKSIKNLEEGVDRSNNRIIAHISKPSDDLPKTDGANKDENKILYYSLRSIYKLNWVNPFIDYNSWDIITNKWFYIPVICVISYYFGFDYYKYLLPKLPIIDPWFNFGNAFFTDCYNWLYRDSNDRPDMGPDIGPWDRDHPYNRYRTPTPPYSPPHSPDSDSGSLTPIPGGSTARDWRASPTIEVISTNAPLTTSSLPFSRSASPTPSHRSLMSDTMRSDFDHFFKDDVE